MPSKTLLGMARKAGKSLGDAERYWSEAKKSALGRGFKEGTERFYKYVTGIVKRRMALAALAAVDVELAKKWSDKIDTHWSPPEGFFGKSAKDIASGLKGASNSLKQAMSRLNFYVNRAGKNLSDEDHSRLESAKRKLVKMYGMETANLGKKDPDLYYVQPDGTFVKGGDRRSKRGLTYKEVKQRDGKICKAMTISDAIASVYAET